MHLKSFKSKEKWKWWNCFPNRKKSCFSPWWRHVGSNAEGHCPNRPSSLEEAAALTPGCPSRSSTACTTALTCQAEMGVALTWDHCCCLKVNRLRGEHSQKRERKRRPTICVRRRRPYIHDVGLDRPSVSSACTRTQMPDVPRWAAAQPPPLQKPPSPMPKWYLLSGRHAPPCSYLYVQACEKALGGYEKNVVN